MRERARKLGLVGAVKHNDVAAHPPEPIQYPAPLRGRHRPWVRYRTILAIPVNPYGGRGGPIWRRTKTPRPQSIIIFVFRHRSSQILESDLKFACRDETGYRNPRGELVLFWRDGRNNHILICASAYQDPDDVRDVVHHFVFVRVRNQKSREIGGARDKQAVIILSDADMDYVGVSHFFIPIYIHDTFPPSEALSGMYLAIIGLIVC
jgi:hypothetical protein